jgi:aconitate hydratase
MSQTSDSFGSKSTLDVGGTSYTVHRLDAVTKVAPNAARLPYSLKILLECLLRTEDGVSVKKDDILALANWNPKAEPDKEIAFMPARVLLQDFTGVPAVVDLAAMRDAMSALGGKPTRINPLQPVELVIDHSVQVDEFGSKDSLKKNGELEFSRNQERYRFLKWGQHAFTNFKAVPPDTGIVHQVNVEFLARVVMTSADGKSAYPDTVVGTDSHTTMVNGLGVLGWGVGGIEAEAAMLGQPASMLIPHVVGVRLTGKLREGATATDLVLTLTQMLRKKGVVGKFVEYFGPGLPSLPLADRATIANMAPEYGATCGIFPVDAETLRYLRFTGRDEKQVALVEAYAKAQGLFHDASTKDAEYTDVMELDLATVEPSLAGPARPQDRVKLSDVAGSYKTALEQHHERANAPGTKKKSLVQDPAVAAATADPNVKNGSVVIAAITSCTNTSNPSVLVAAGLVAKKATDRGLTAKPWVKTSLAPGSQVVTEYLKAASLLEPLEKANFFVVGYGCTTCIGNSGPLPVTTSKAVGDGDLVVAAVLSGNRNFEGRVHAEVRANYLASPPLVVAYALAGRVDFDFEKDALGKDKAGKDVFLKDIWPTQKEVSDTVDAALKPEMFKKVYGDVYKGDDQWRGLKVPEGEQFAWEKDSTYVKHPPYFVDMAKTPDAVTDIVGARVLAKLGDSITTDHISPAGNIKKDSPAGKYLQEHGVAQADFNSYGSRRGNHEVMVRGTFANIRLRNQLTPGTEGGVTKHLPSGDVTSIFEASERYIKDGVALIVLAGKEYGSGSSRDWAAKGPKLLGVRAVIAESYERIHRSNLVGMGILPLEYAKGQNAESLGLTGEETFDIKGLDALLGALLMGMRERRTIKVTATSADGKTTELTATVRIDTPTEIHYYKNGGVLPYVLRQLVK